MSGREGGKKKPLKAPKKDGKVRIFQCLLFYCPHRVILVGIGRGRRKVQAATEGAAEEARRDEGEGGWQGSPGDWRHQKVWQEVITFPGCDLVTFSSAARARIHLTFLLIPNLL